MVEAKRFTSEMLSPDQREVYEGITAWVCNSASEHENTILTVGGYAGTGKSTLLGVFAAETKLNVAYVSLTGRAASVLRGKLRAAGANVGDKLRAPEAWLKRYANGKPVPSKIAALYDFSGKHTSYCGTVHSLLYRPVINDDTEEIKGWAKRAELDRPYQLIVVDEASMISDDMLRDLESFGVPILAVGDHGQLPPVMGASDLMRSPKLRLEAIHRQAEGNPIIQLSKSIRETGRFDINNSDAIRFCRRNDDAALQAIFTDARENKRLLDVGVLCWMNKTRVKLNAHARIGAGFKGVPNLGEVVICLKNTPPLFNGMRASLASPGELVDWRVQSTAFFRDEGISEEIAMCAPQFNRDRTFSSLIEMQERLPRINKMAEGGLLFDFGYAMTVHKSQGTQFDHAIFYVDRRVEPDNEDWRRFAYTAVTRAIKRLTIFT